MCLSLCKALKRTTKSFALEARERSTERRSYRPLVSIGAARGSRVFLGAKAMGLTIALEGNIGAGKTTFLSYLKKKGWRCVDEPVVQWQGAEGGENLLSMFYADPKRWAFTFQTFAFISRSQAALGTLRHPPNMAPPASQPSASQLTSQATVLERSLHSDKHCFAKNCHMTGLMKDAEWGVYENYHSWIMNEHPELRCDVIVYLRTDPQRCLEHIRKRGRKEEETITLSYLQELHQRHEEWLSPPQHGPGGGASLSTDQVKVLTLTCESDWENDLARCEEMCEAISDFIEMIPAT